MRLWFVNSWAWVCFVGLVLMVVALAGFGTNKAIPKIAIRIVGATFGLAIIIFGIWMNARWLIH